jgi:hypothetical protein
MSTTREQKAIAFLAGVVWSAERRGADEERKAIVKFLKDRGLDALASDIACELHAPETRVEGIELFTEEAADA